jgi:aldehyde:ferredoxin oxidoreductase
MDTISCGATIAFAMECYEKGLITKEDTGGLELVWGSAEAMVEATRQIGVGEGIGKLLGQGTRKVAEQLGGDALDFAVQVKGLEVPMHDPRAYFSWGLTYATSPRGACHLHGISVLYENEEDPIPEWDLMGYYPRHSNEGKAQITRLAQDWAHVVNSMVICYFATFTLDPSHLSTLVNRATGYDLAPKDLITIGDRIHALYLAYNYRCGSRRQDDKLPVRSMMPLAEGGTQGKVLDLEGLLDEYYEIRHLEPDGKPSYETLVALGLEDVAQDLYGRSA